MPLVFVHGIGNRDDERFRQWTVGRDALFRRFLFPAIGADPREPILSPTWTDARHTLRWNGASVPTGSHQRLGALDEAAALLAEVVDSERPERGDRILCTVAARDMADAVDLLFAAVPPSSPVSPDSLGAAAQRLVAHCQSRERLCPGGDQYARYPWLASVRDDSGLVRELWKASAREDPGVQGQASTGRDQPAVEVMGAAGAVPGWMGASLRRIRQSTVGVATAGAARIVRAAAARRVALLAGDVMGYLARRGDSERPGSAVESITTALRSATRGRTGSQPLVVVAHSLGGVISYDILSHFRPDLTVDLLVTVGSQVSLFEELGLLRSSDPHLPTPLCQRAAVPHSIRRWINIVDPADVLAFQAEPVFDRVSDHTYPSAALWAHGAYLRQPHFHDRLARRVRQALT